MTPFFNVWFRLASILDVTDRLRMVLLLVHRFCIDFCSKIDPTTLKIIGFTIIKPIIRRKQEISKYITLWCHLVAVLGPFGLHLLPFGLSWLPFWLSLGCLCPLRAPFAPLWGSFRLALAPFGPLLGSLGLPLGSLWDPFFNFWCRLGSILDVTGRLRMVHLLLHCFCINVCSENRPHDSQNYWFYYSKTYDSQKTGSFEIYYFLV